ncbi:MAG TPA: hypothetical protein PKO06_08695 [Candidatus Ozemobacteraceae bacterium]|nr:hypothetical protein [Candidatus Ozemobacteraceae bacterium]
MKTEPRDLPFDLLVDQVYQRLLAAEPQDARAVLDALVAEQSGWANRCAVESAIRQLLVTEHLRLKARLHERT